MDFINYIKIIHPYCGCKSQHETIVKLYQAAGAQQEVVPETAKSWLKRGNGHRNCTIKNFFPKAKLNETGFIDFFETRVNSDWKKLQTAFSSIDNDNIVDLHTDIVEDFYWSLLNQFQKIYQLPLSKKPITLNNTSICNEIIKTFKETAEFYHIADFIAREPAFLEFKNLDMNYDLRKSAEQFIEEIEYCIIVLFRPYENEIVYIKISRFIFLIKEYLHHISTSFYSDKAINSFLSHNRKSILTPEFEAEKHETNIMRFQVQLKNIYEEICNMYIH